MHPTPEFIGLCVAGTVIALERYTNLLDRFKKKSSADAAGELSIADRTIERLRGERNQERSRADELEHTRSLAPVLELIQKVADTLERVAGTCDLTFDKLASFNGSLGHVEDSLAETRQSLATTSEGLKALVGTIAELHDIPLKPPTRG